MVMKRLEVFFRLVYGYSWKSAGVVPSWLRPVVAAGLFPLALDMAWSEVKTESQIEDWYRRLRR